MAVLLIVLTTGVHQETLAGTVLLWLLLHCGLEHHV